MLRLLAARTLRSAPAAPRHRALAAGADSSVSAPAAPAPAKQAPKKSEPSAKQKQVARSGGRGRGEARPAAGRGGRGEGRGRGRGDARPTPPRVSDVLEHSVTMIDDHDGTALRRIPKGAEVPVAQAVRDFVRRDLSTPGPTTYVYLPPSVGREYEKKPPARTIDELIEYTTTTQHAPPVTDERCAASVDFAWSVLAKQPDITETQKSKIMAKVHHTMHKIQDDDALLKLFALPEQTVPDDEKLQKKKASKRKK